MQNFSSPSPIATAGLLKSFLLTKLSSFLKACLPFGSLKLLLLHETSFTKNSQWTLSFLWQHFLLALPHASHQFSSEKKKKNPRGHNPRTLKGKLPAIRKLKTKQYLNKLPTPIAVYISVCCVYNYMYNCIHITYNCLKIFLCVCQNVNHVCQDFMRLQIWGNSLIGLIVKCSFLNFCKLISKLFSLI